MNRKASFVAVIAALNNLTSEELLAIADRPDLLKQFASKLVTETLPNTYVAHMDDKDVPKQYSDAVVKWRNYANSLGYTGPVAWRVREGFTLKTHAPLAGRCRGIQELELKYDEPTKNAIVFWVPRLAERSTCKSVLQMESVRGGLKQHYELPAHHATSFGSSALLSALILEHFKCSGERVPLRNYYAVSDSIRVGGRRLLLGDFSESGLDYFHGVKSGRIGFFLLGVEELE